ncbi:hypothetical protein LSH36_826g01056 [Paralvinella palmiformis]|uniref:Sushi domain-containing protein n=1 Tax=Paralvinella palmiformis TaxID=53620 RepID=A0AAD9J0C7_9ANNE|nr:hypothetical protein LSH36_826g01056 [Paralvinella palmiformis]
MNSLPDCGHVTPRGFVDIWMSTVLVDPGDLSGDMSGSCSRDVVIGPPKSGPYCHLKHNESLSWRPECLNRQNRIPGEIYNLELDVYAVSIRTSDWLKHASDTHCQGDGFYDGILDKCLTADDVCEQATCSRPAVKHGDVICQGYAEGRQCHVTCKQGYNLFGSEEYLTCTNNTWIGNIHCEPVDCGVPRLPHTVMDCPDGTTYFIGDGYCDVNNNQARCQWDGGDCCLSTSSSGFVTSCGPGCMCKDPDAIENRDVVNRARRHHRTGVEIRHGANHRKWHRVE